MRRNAQVSQNTRRKISKNSPAKAESLKISDGYGFEIKFGRCMYVRGLRNPRNIKVFTCKRLVIVYNLHFAYHVDKEKLDLILANLSDQ